MINQICTPRIFFSTFHRCAFFIAVLVFLSSTAGLAQTSPHTTESPAAAGVRALNNSLLLLHGQMQQADANSARTLRGQAATVIAQRAAALTNLIWNDPRAALSFAFSPELLADLAAKFPQSASLLESHTTVTGSAQHWIADYSNGSRSWWRMTAGGQALNLHFAGPEPRTLGPGEVLQATGVVVGSQMAVETSSIIQSAAAGLSTNSSGPATKAETHGWEWPTSMLFVFGFVLALPGLSEKNRLSRARILSILKRLAIYGLVFTLFVFTSTPMYAQNSCSTTGVQNVAVILVTFPGVTPPSTLTPQSVQDMFFGATAPSVTTYWQEASYGMTSATGNVFGWFTLNGTYSSTACQSLTAMQSDAISAAAAAGANFQNYSRIVVVFPDTLGCGWSGLSTIGCSSLSTPSGAVNASSSYISASYATVQVATHELGHGLGLNHASSRGFTDNSGTPAALGPIGAAGTLTEYGDKFSTMGCCDLAEYGAPHKAEILDWLPSGTGYQTVQTSGTYLLQPYETLGGLKALKVQRGTGNSAWLWLEYRQPDGNYDPLSFPSPLWTTLPPQPYSGALIHYEDSTTGIHTHLINYTPSDSSFFSPALVAGQSWSDPYTNLSLSVTGATATGLTVDVNYSGSVQCTPANPTIKASPLDPSIYPGSNAAYSLAITDNDSSGCASNTFALGSTQPSGWPTTFSATSVTLGPGQSASAIMYKTGPSGTPPGTYAVDANAASNSYSASDTANVTVMIPPSLTVAVSVPATGFTLRSTVPIAATVLNSGAPASGASVTFTLTSPNGAATTQAATASSSGTATWSYKLGPKSVTGTYSVSAQAVLSSGSRKATTTQSATSNTATFTVQ